MHEAFQKLCDLYANALVSFVSTPETEAGWALSPELLVSVEDKTIFKTTALAGTQPYNEGINLKTVAWTQKDIEEQALVERYIISCFKKIRLREYDEHGPKNGGCRKSDAPQIRLYGGYESHQLSAAGICYASTPSSHLCGLWRSVGYCAGIFK